LREIFWQSIFCIDYYHYYLSKAGKPSEILKQAIEKGTSQVSNHFKPLLIEFVATYFNQADQEFEALSGDPL
jgi:hypothetical protein